MSVEDWNYQLMEYEDYKQLHEEDERMNINDALTKEYNRGFADGKASVEQKHGHWICLGFDVFNDSDNFKCSLCDSIVKVKCQADYNNLKYCGHCGAKMDEEVTE